MYFSLVLLAKEKSSFALKVGVSLLVVADTTVITQSDSNRFLILRVFLEIFLLKV